MTNAEGPRYRAADLVEHARALFAAAGCDGDKPATIAEGLVEADLLGHSTHGLQLAAAYLGELAAGTDDVASVLAALTELELLGLVRRDFGGRYVRAAA